jgi:hypothetical protein
MFLEYVHKITKVWRLWDFDGNRAIECLNVVWREDQNAFDMNMSGAKAFL